MDEKNGMEPQSRTKRHRGIEQMGKEAIVHANLRSDFSTLFIFRFYLHRVRLLTTTTTTNGEKNKERIQTATLKWAHTHSERDTQWMWTNLNENKSKTENEKKWTWNSMEIQMFITYSGIDKFVFFTASNWKQHTVKQQTPTFKPGKKLHAVFCRTIATITKSRGRIPFFLSLYFILVVQALKN